MVTDTAPVETEPQVDQETPQTETETPEPVEGAESAAPVEEPAATDVPQVEVTDQKPEYITRDEWEKEKEAVRQKAAADALEDDRRRRQTENARRAQQEERQKARLQQTVDVVKASLVSRGIDPDVATDETVLRTVDRVAQERAESIVKEQGDLVAPAWDYLIGATQELDDGAKEMAHAIRPKLQALIDSIRPQIEAKAREGYIAESELSKRVDAEIARRNAKAREGQEELKRPEGQPSTVDKNSLGYWETRIAHEGEEGHPDLSPADWAAYRQIRRQHGFS